MTNIAQNLHKLNDDIAKICQKYDKNKHDINLIAVSKTISADKIEEVLKCGYRNFGENKVDETKRKWPLLQEKYPDVKLHLIGHLQSNKAKDAVKIFDFIHSLDSLKLANILKAEMDKQQKFPKIFIQVNIGAEESKTGVALSETDDFIFQIKNEVNLPIFGLMCIPPADKDAHQYFTALKDIAKRHKIEYLSMGMSGDYEAAIAVGSNFIRIGTAIFGQREF